MKKILTLTPQGHLKVIPALEDSVDSAMAIIHDKKIADAFSQSQVQGLLALLAAHNDDLWSKGLKFWREYMSQYAHDLCHKAASDSGGNEMIPAPDDDELASWVMSIPPILGAEYCTINVLKMIWVEFDTWVRHSIENNYQSISQFLKQELPSWHQVGRVCFHLVENKQDEDFPFAFIATYAASLGKNNKIQHKPLNQALQEYAGTANKKALTHLLRPISAAAEQCDWLDNLVASHDIYHPLAWSPEEAFQLLKSVPLLEAFGLTVKFPNWWKKPKKPQVQVTIGDDKKKHFGAEELLQFNVNVALEGQPLSKSELKEILSSDDGLILLRGQWVELDKEKLTQALEHWETLQNNAGSEGLSFIEGMRLLSGIDKNLAYSEDETEIKEWCHIQASQTIRDILKSLRNPQSLSASKPGKLLKTQLRHYQESGVAWLNLLTELGLGACLADDMGLGKTIQIIALLLIRKKRKPLTHPAILILPASLLANWQLELKRFAPSLNTLILHASALDSRELKSISENPDLKLKDIDIVVTSYGMLLRQTWLTEQPWNLVILDEAQAIKNPSSRQTKSVKKLRGKARIALTGTPVENRLGDLWSLFDFVCPGLLGSSKQFKQFIKSLEKSEHASYAPLRQLVAPYILRRLKSDKRIISDLPDKSEVDAWCGLSKAQAKLYAQSVNEMADMLQKTEEGMKRRGLVLAFLTRFKQICNHPSQLLGNGDYIEKDSGKFARLREICEEIASRQEKVLIFTQYREMTEPLALFLADIFAEPGLILHGGTAVKKRKSLVENFQREDGSPFFVLSLKAAGTGLNLTAASHVIHFDRWWNPAVENQATDRAYRIGQKKNVLVHKFICKGTVEEKINLMIKEKQSLANELLESDGEINLTEMNDQQLLDLVSLDIHQATV